MTATVQSSPQFLNARTNIYTAWDLRRHLDGPPPGPGVADYEAFRVQQRQAGANMSVDVGKTAVGLMQAWVRGSTRGAQGLYRVDNADTTAPTADTYLAQLNDTVVAADATNPRIDQVVLEVLDQQHTGASNLAQIRVVAGTPTGGATLDNRTGVAALPASSILLADVLVPAASASVVTANIRDRRPFPLRGTLLPAAGVVATDAVTLEPHPAIPPTGGGATLVQSTVAFDAAQAAAAMYLPRRIAGVTKVRWRYAQQGTANAANYILGIYDASGRQVAATAATAYTGTASQAVQEASVALLATTTFDAGWYYVFVGNAAGTAGGSVQAAGVGGNTNAAAARGVYFRNAAGGAVLPASLTILGMTDVGAAASAAAIQIPSVPILTLSVA